MSANMKNTTQRQKPYKLSLLASLILFAVNLLALMFIGCRFHNELGLSKILTTLHIVTDKNATSKNAEQNVTGDNEDNNNVPGHRHATVRHYYTIELAVEKDESLATIKVGELNQKGIAAFYTPLRAGNHNIYRIRVGIYSDVETALATLATLKINGFSHPRVTKL